MKLIICLLISFLLLGAMSTSLSVANEHSIIYVDDDGTADFTSIQDAIIAANPGDTIFVYSGIYYEHITINTASITLQGENEETTIIDGQGRDDVIGIRADKVIISGFTIQHSGRNYWDDGIEICADLTTISGNLIKENNGGIYVRNCRFNTIKNNSITANIDSGIELLGVICSTIERNEIINNRNNYDTAGIIIEHVNNIKIRRNTIRDNNIGLTVLDNAVAPWLFPTQQNWIIHNNFIDNDIHAGVYDRMNAYGSNFLCMRFLHNYWSDHYIPFKIIWTLGFYSSRYPVDIPCNFDLCPAFTPLDIL